LSDHLAILIARTSNYLLPRIKVFVSVALAPERRGVENVPTGTL
jgi:hypothetical protein